MKHVGADGERTGVVRMFLKGRVVELSISIEILKFDVIWVLIAEVIHVVDDVGLKSVE